MNPLAFDYLVTWFGVFTYQLDFNFTLHFYHAHSSLTIIKQFIPILMSYCRIERLLRLV